MHEDFYFAISCNLNTSYKASHSYTRPVFTSAWYSCAFAHIVPQCILIVYFGWHEPPRCPPKHAISMLSWTPVHGSILLVCFRAHRRQKCRKKLVPCSKYWKMLKIVVLCNKNTPVHQSILLVSVYWHCPRMHAIYIRWSSDRVKVAKIAERC